MVGAIAIGVGQNAAAFTAAITAPGDAAPGKGLDRLVKALEGIFYVGSVAAALVAVLEFRNRTRYQIKRDKYEKYVELNNRYLDYLRLINAHPLLVADEPGVTIPQLSASDEYRQRQLVDYFFNLAEEAFILKEYMPGQQWTGWDVYIRSHCGIPEFREYWYEKDGTLKKTASLDADFEQYVHEILELA